MITENGIADSADKNHARFGLEHLFQLRLAREFGASTSGATGTGP